MKNWVLTFIILVALYTLLRNNVFILPDQIIWISSPDLFYKVFIPLLMMTSTIAAIIKKEKTNFLYLSFGSMLIDAINRFAIGVNHIYLCQVYKEVPTPPLAKGAVRVVTNLWPSHIMLFIEVILIIMIVRLFMELKPSIVETSS